MFPGGMDPRQMKMAMKRLGIQQDELEATEVIIRLSDREIVITNPSVTLVNMQGQKSYQIAGEEEERALSSGDSSPEISEEDVQTVIDATNVSVDEARAAIEENNGDLAAAIMSLKKD